MTKSFILASIFFFLSPCTYAGWIGPKDYDECILENMKGVSVQSAETAIKDACNKKYPPRYYYLSTSEVRDLKTTLYINEYLTSRLDFVTAPKHNITDVHVALKLLDSNGLAIRNMSFVYSVREGILKSTDDGHLPAPPPFGMDATSPFKVIHISGYKTPQVNFSDYAWEITQVRAMK